MDLSKLTSGMGRSWPSGTSHIRELNFFKIPSSLYPLGNNGALLVRLQDLCKNYF
jgi:hypothetical protein